MIDESDRVRLQVDMWKQTIAVQQHFNDVELKVRGLALTVLTFSLGAAAVAIKDGTEVKVGRWDVQLASLVLLSACIVWILFYFVDQIWYHRLLLGAVKHGEYLENLIEQELEGSGLTKSISANSPYTFTIGLRGLCFKFKLHSRHKMKIFYYVVFLVLLGLAVVVQISVRKSPELPGTVPRASAPIAVDVRVCD